VRFRRRGALRFFTWGYDEITWFAHQPEEYRNEWLRYAWRWLKEHDPDGFLEMPGGRMLTNGPAGAKWYFANRGQEIAIRAIWDGDK
jgi:hypothetical protein